MKEEDAARIFKAASSIGWMFEIDLLGDESIVPLPGPGGEGDYRLSDSEHIVHELAHVVLYGLDLYPADTAMIRLSDHCRELPEQEQRINELETFSVTAEVMRRLGVEIEDGVYTDSMEIAIHGIEVPEGYDYPERRRQAWIMEQFRTFHQTERGRAAVEKLMGLMRSAGA